MTTDKALSQNREMRAYLDWRCSSRLYIVAASMTLQPYMCAMTAMRFPAAKLSSPCIPSSSLHHGFNDSPRFYGCTNA